MTKTKSKDRENLVRFSVTVPENLLEEFEQRYYASNRNNRSEAIRNLMRKYISGERWRYNAGEIFATVTIVYDHHTNGLTGKLTAAQHDYGDMIICSTHAHISHETCLECIITKGLSEDIQKFVETLRSIRGIKSLNVNVASEI